ncbi:MAG: hypothetical protein J6N76_03130 [Lachnospiraceae bacterium]|nr:hypothetical protein [Lachnospiraceae bacterium]
MNLLDGSFTGKNLQIGALSGQKLELNIRAMNTHALGLTTQFDDALSNGGDEQGAINVLKNDISSPSLYNIGRDGDETLDMYGNHVHLEGDTSKRGQYNSDECLWVKSHGYAGITMQLVQNATDVVSAQRATLGAYQQRLEHTIANLDNTSENTQRSESIIRDTDMSKEMLSYSKNRILSQAGQAMLAQSNHSLDNVIGLLR